MVLAKGALTMQWDPEKLVEAFSPQKKEGPRSLAAFRAAFEDLVSKVPGVTRVVVLVDDLDRCLPDATVATLEAIKLFLSVKRMAFVIAADPGPGPRRDLGKPRGDEPVQRLRRALP